MSYYCYVSNEHKMLMDKLLCLVACKHTSLYDVHSHKRGHARNKRKNCISPRYWQSQLFCYQIYIAPRLFVSIFSTFIHHEFEFRLTQYFFPNKLLFTYGAHFLFSVSLLLCALLMTIMITYMHKHSACKCGRRFGVLDLKCTIYSLHL